MEVKRRYSRQRECILEALRRTKRHPSASSIYDEVRKEIPNISLGTVYRNLAELSMSGEILKLDAGDGTERYDGNPDQHYHMICKKCRSVIDIELDYDKELDRKVKDLCGAEIDFHSVLFSGVCSKCLNEK